jgi:hypothetical protein
LRPDTKASVREAFYYLREKIMSDFDMDAFDSIDFDSVEQSVAEKQAEKDKQESQEIEGMRDGANDCGDSCTI